MHLFSWDLKQLEPFLPIVVPLLALGAFGVYYYFEGRKKKEALGKLARRIRGEVGGFFSQSLRGTYEGVKFSLTLIPAGKNTPPYLTVEFFKAMPFTLQVGTENVLTRFGKRLGVVKEVSVHDPEFDKRFFIRSDNERRAASFLEQPDVRQAITAIFDQGFDSLCVDRRRLCVRKPNYVFPGDLDGDRVVVILRTLLVLLKIG